MSIYIVTAKATGAEIYRYSADAPQARGRRVSKNNFIDLLGDAAYIAILTLAKSVVEVEAFVKRLEMATPESDGTSVDLDDQRTVLGVRTIGSALSAQGIVEADWSDRVLGVHTALEAPVDTPAFAITHRVTLGGIERQACIDPDGTVRFDDGKWTTLDSLAAMSATVEVI